MNLWVKRTGQLFLIAVALFFLSCKDEVTFLGFPNPNSKFKLNYIEIPLESSVYRIDSVRTSNSAGELNRILVGKYADPAFGDVKATAFLELSPMNTTFSVPVADHPKITVDSVYLNMRIDFYSYGAAGTKVQTFNVHQLTEEISVDTAERAANRYYSKKNDVDYNPTPIGTQTFEVNPTEFKIQFEKGASAMKDTLLSVKLDLSFGELLMARAKLGGEDYSVQTRFIKYVKGLAIVPGDDNDKIIGFDHNNDIRPDTIQSRVVVFFHLTGDTTYRTISYGNYISYTNLEVERNAVNSPDLFDITEMYTPKDPPEYRYAQTGTGVVTRVDFSNFFAFADTIDRMIINSAELAITDYETADPYYPINNFTMLMLDSVGNIEYRNTRYLYAPVRNNDDVIIGYNPYVHPHDASIMNRYKGYLADVSGFMTAIGDNGAAVALRRDGPSFSSHITMLSQKLYENEGWARYRYFGLFPSDPPNGKSVNRLIFNKNSLKLKIYYTIPTQPSN